MASGYKYKLKKQLQNRKAAARRIARLNRSLSGVVGVTTLNVWKMFPKSAIGGMSRGLFSNELSGLVSYGILKSTKNIGDKMLDDVRIDDIMRHIMNEAVKNAPIDKRYIGIKPNRKDLKSMKFSVPMFENFKEREKPKTYTSDETNHREVSYTYGRKIMENPNKDIKFKDIDLFKDFSLEKQRMIRRLLTKGVGKEKLRADKRSLWYNERDGSLNWYRASNPEKKNIKLATSFGDNLLHYGEEELRRSARYNKALKLISFDPTRLGTKYNYAALQHDRLDFTHKVGGAMYLYNAYINNREKLIAVIEEVIADKINAMRQPVKTTSNNGVGKEAEQIVKTRISSQLSSNRSGIKSAISKYARGI